MNTQRAFRNEEGKIEWPWVDLTKPFHGAVALGNMTQYNISAFYDGSELVVSVEGKGSYSFSRFVHYSYAMEKLGIKYEIDARNFSDWINTQLGIEREPQGKYNYPELLALTP